MKTIMSLMLGLSLLAGTATFAFGQTDTNKKSSKKKKKKGGTTTDKKA